MRKTIASLLFLAACTGGHQQPKTGDSCSHEGSATCDGSAAALFCESGTYHRYECKGPNGCNTSGGNVHCGETNAADGDPCPRSAEGYGECHSADTKLVCRQGIWTAERCLACAYDSTMITCGG